MRTDIKLDVVLMYDYGLAGRCEILAPLRNNVKKVKEINKLRFLKKAPFFPFIRMLLAI